MTPILTTLDDLKLHLGLALDDTAEDARLEQLLVGLDWAVAAYTQRQAAPGRHPFEHVSATEYYDGTGRELLMLRRRPVTAITSLRVDATGAYGQRDGSFPESTAWTEGTHFALPRTDASEDNVGAVVCLLGEWPEGRGNIQVTYSAGYDEIPPEIPLAVHQLADAVRKGIGKGGIIGSETIGRYSYSLLAGSPAMGADAGLSVAQARGILDRYVEVAG